MTADDRLTLVMILDGADVQYRLLRDCMSKEFEGEELLLRCRNFMAAIRKRIDQYDAAEAAKGDA
jgi:hypothetical protein